MSHPHYPLFIPIHPQSPKAYPWSENPSNIGIEASDSIPLSLTDSKQSICMFFCRLQPMDQDTWDHCTCKPIIKAHVHLGIDDRVRSPCVQSKATLKPRTQLPGPCPAAPKRLWPARPEVSRLLGPTKPWDSRRNMSHRDLSSSGGKQGQGFQHSEASVGRIPAGEGDSLNLLRSGGRCYPSHLGIAALTFMNKNYVPFCAVCF